MATAPRSGSRWPSWARALAAPLVFIALWYVVHDGNAQRAAWRTQLVDRGIGGDALQYWHMAIHMEREGMVSLDGRNPTWYRLPGYPALLRATTNPAESDVGPTDPASIKVRVDAWLVRAVNTNLAVDLLTAVAAFLLALALGAGPLALGAAALWARQPWSSVIAIHPLSDPLATLATTLCLAALAWAARRGQPGWFLVAGALAGAAQYVRPDSVLLLPALLIGGLVSPGRWPLRLLRAAIALLAWSLVFAPWPMRNYRLFGAPHPLGAAGLDAHGELLDRTVANAWLRTFAVGAEQETVDVAWRMPSQEVAPASLPRTAYDGPAERRQVLKFLDDYNAGHGTLTPVLSERLAEIATERRRHHPFDHYVRLPVTRAWLRLWPPRDGYGLGTLPTLATDGAAWVWGDRIVVAMGLAALALLLVRRPLRPAGAAVLSWLLLRLMLIGWIPAPEPRYFLEALPLLAAAAATLPAAVLAALRPRAGARRAG